MLAACNRGPGPAQPNESLVPTAVSLIAEAGSARPPFRLSTGYLFAPEGGTTVRRIATTDLDDDLTAPPEPGDLLLSGQDDKGIWWAAVHRGSPPSELTRQPVWCITVGAFEEGDLVHFGSGLIVPKSIDFHAVGP